MGLEFSSDLGDPKFNPYPASCVFPSKGDKIQNWEFSFAEGLRLLTIPKIASFPVLPSPEAAII